MYITQEEQKRRISEGMSIINDCICRSESKAELMCIQHHLRKMYDLTVSIENNFRKQDIIVAEMDNRLNERK